MVQSEGNYESTFKHLTQSELKINSERWRSLIYAQPRPAQEKHFEWEKRSRRVCSVWRMIFALGGNWRLLRFIYIFFSARDGNLVVKLPTHFSVCEQTHEFCIEGDDLARRSITKSIRIWNVLPSPAYLLCHENWSETLTHRPGERTIIFWSWNYFLIASLYSLQGLELETSVRSQLIYFVNICIQRVWNKSVCAFAIKRGPHSSPNKYYKYVLEKPGTWWLFIRKICVSPNEEANTKINKQN